MNKNQRKSKEMFDSLVVNAIEFLVESISEFKRKPKYSVINFYAALELFLKARLMIEHWALINETPESANLTKFLIGDFKSVGMTSAIQRLQNIAEIKISKEAQQTFDKLREHRNKLIHFFHPEYIKAPDPQTAQEIVLEQSRGWFHLHRLLTKDWANEFTAHLDKIEELHLLMRNQRSYLQAKYESLRPSIEEGKSRGKNFFTCASCGYDSSSIKQISNNLYSSVCLVCDLKTHSLREPCPACQTIIEVNELAEGECNDCEFKIDLKYLLDKYAESNYLGEGMYETNRVYCSHCEYTEEPTVVPLAGKWLCLMCLTLYDEVDQCGWCSEDVAGDLEGSYLSGCLFCDGMLGHHADD